MDKPTSQIIDCAIIGAGPAGLSAAIQAVRQGLSVEIFEENEPGGQALAANLIENFPGFIGGISGRELMKRFILQAASHGVQIRNEKVVEVKKDGELFSIRTNLKKIQTKTVIVACGLKPKKLEIPGEESLFNKNIFAYADPEKIPHSDKNVVVVGSGDAAFDLAINFSHKASKVSIAMKHGEPKCNLILKDRVTKIGIPVLPGYEAVSFKKNGDGVIINFGNGEKIYCDIVIECIGKESKMDFLSPDLSSLIYFAGDCCQGLNRHIAIAVGDGVRAAMEAHENCIKTR